MALGISYLHYIESSIKQAFGENVNGLRMLELGDQITFGPDIVEKTGKAYFENRGFKHSSIDLNGHHDSLALDLRKPELFLDLYGMWDILTNAGTSEHIEPFEKQYECFSIIHDCIKVGGIAIHLVPDVYEHDEYNRWLNHCRYYYSEAFFELLAKECQYELLSNTVINGLRCVTIKKIKDEPFMSDRHKFLNVITQREMVHK